MKIIATRHWMILGLGIFFYSGIGFATEDITTFNETNSYFTIKNVQENSPYKNFFKRIYSHNSPYIVNPNIPTTLYSKKRNFYETSYQIKKDRYRPMFKQKIRSPYRDENAEKRRFNRIFVR